MADMSIMQIIPFKNWIFNYLCKKNTFLFKEKIRILYRKYGHTAGQFPEPSEIVTFCVASRG
jgi:hypothetical protein